MCLSGLLVRTGYIETNCRLQCYCKVDGRLLPRSGVSTDRRNKAFLRPLCAISTDRYTILGLTGESFFYF